jgi:hypothetical protein
MRPDFPDWLEFSGLPRELNEKARQGAWSVFKKVVELDCRRNATPEAVEISVAELGERTGILAKTVRRLLDGLRRRRVLLVFLPETDDEPALFQIRVPLPTPIPFEEVAKQHADLHLLEPRGNDRYAREEGPVDPEDPAIRAVVDLYLNTLSLRMNSFILDELIFIARRYPGQEIERVFRHAAHLKITRGLGWVVRELSRRHGKEKRPPRRRRRP